MVNEMDDVLNTEAYQETIADAAEQSIPEEGVPMTTAETLVMEETAIETEGQTS